MLGLSRGAAWAGAAGAECCFPFVCQSPVRLGFYKSSSFKKKFKKKMNRGVLAAARASAGVAAPAAAAPGATAVPAAPASGAARALLDYRFACANQNNLAGILAALERGAIDVGHADPLAQRLASPFGNMHPHPQQELAADSANRRRPREPPCIEAKESAKYLLWFFSRKESREPGRASCCVLPYLFLLKEYQQLETLFAPRAEPRGHYRAARSPASAGRLLRLARRAGLWHRATVDALVLI
jgi:hypothetical protein